MSVVWSHPWNFEKFVTAGVLVKGCEIDFRYKSELLSACPLLLVSCFLEASRLGMTSLAAECLRSLSCPLPLEALVSVATAAETLGDDTLLREAIEVLKDNAFALFSSKQPLQSVLLFLSALR